MLKRAIIVFACALAAIAYLWLTLEMVRARDLDGRYANSPHKDWFDAQHNARGTSCCHEGDAHRYDGDYTLNQDGSVTLGNGRALPEWMVLKGTNPTGAAIYWFRDYENGQRTDYCFSPGTMG